MAKIEDLTVESIARMDDDQRDVFIQLMVQGYPQLAQDLCRGLEAEIIDASNQFATDRVA